MNMKMKIFLTLCIFCYGYLYSMANENVNSLDNVVYLDDVSANAGDELSLSLKLKNKDAVIGYNFKLILPEGVTVMSSVNDFGDEIPDVTMTEVRTNLKRHTFKSSLKNDVLTILCYSNTNKLILDNEGEIAKVKVKIASNVQTGTYPIRIVEEAISLENSTPVIDLIESALIISNTSNSDLIYMEDTKAIAGGCHTLSVKMKNSFEASGFQFDMLLPHGFSVATDDDDMYMAELSTVRTTIRKTNYFDAAPSADGYFHVICSTSAKNATTNMLYVFSGNDGEVCTIVINIDESLTSGDYELILKNIVITDINSVGHPIDGDMKSIVSVTSSSYEVDLVDGEPYTNATTTTCDKLTFTKTFSASAAGNWNAFYVPMSVNVEEYSGDLDFAEIYAFCATVDTNGDGVVDANDDNFLFVRPVKTGSIKPNVPYLIRPREAKTYVINSADNVLYKATEGKVEFGTTIEKYTVTGLNNSFTVTAGDNNFYVSATGKLNYRTTGSTTVKANRWIMHRESQEYGGGNNNDIAGAKEYRIITMGEDMDEATAIKAINASNANNSGVYTLDGRKVNDVKSLPNGIYIKDGNKIFINN